METLEELQKILDDAPIGKTMITSDGAYIDDDDLGCMAISGDYPFGVTRSLADIQRIVDLMTLNQNMHTAVAGYLYSKDWEHWNEFNAGKFKL